MFLCRYIDIKLLYIYIIWKRPRTVSEKNRLFYMQLYTMNADEAMVKNILKIAKIYKRVFLEQLYFKCK